MVSDPVDAESREGALVVELIDGGCELAGAAAGAAIGLIAGPVGAFGGAAAGVIVGRSLKRVGAEVRQRVMGPREEARVGATVAFAVQAIGERLAAGEAPRSDGFFEVGTDDRPKADEVLEGVLIGARDAYEERKLPHLAALYASIAFSDISAGQANQLVILAGALTYRQFALLAIAASAEQKSGLRQTEYRGDLEATNALGSEGVAILTEIFDLYQRGLMSDSGDSAWLYIGDVAPGNIQPAGVGRVLAEMANLSAVPLEDRSEILSRLCA